MRYGTGDMKRIVELPVVQRPNQEWATVYSPTIVRPDAPLNADGSRFALKVEQAWALHAYRTYGGLIAPIAVGGGKTLVTLAIAQAAIWERRHKRVLLLVPNDAIIQLVEKDIPWAKKRIRMDYSWHLIAGKPPQVRAKIATSGEPGVYIMSYSQLSTSDSVDLLQAIQPTAIVADEAHRLSNPRAARTKRLFQILSDLQAKAAGTKVDYVFLSGTLTRKRLMDMHRLMLLGLGPLAPVPVQYHVMKEWDNQLSTDNQTMMIDDTLHPLIAWAQSYFPSEIQDLKINTVGARRAFALRMRHAPGVVTSIEGSTEASLLIEDTASPITPSDPDAYAKLLEHVANLDKYGIKPNGDMVPTPMHLFKERFELTSGIYNDKYWPPVEEIQRIRGISFNEALDLMGKSKEWLREEQTLFSLIFQFTKNSPVGLDTPRDIGQAIAQGKSHMLPPDLVAQYHRVKSLDFPGRLERRDRVVRVCDFKVRAVVDAVSKRPKEEGCLVWAYNVGVQEWLSEALKAAGEPVISCRAGDDSAKRLILDPANKHCVFVCSLTAYSEILNLQHLGINYYAQWPRQAKVIEQSLGRTHRSGQERDEIVAYTFLQTDIDHEIMGASLVDATYAHQILRSPQKAVVARYNPPPKLPPLELLYERVPDIERVPPEVAKEYLRRFGS